MSNDMVKGYLEELKMNLSYHFSQVLGQPLAKPRWVYISLSHKCTYDCQMCGVVKILKGFELSPRILEEAFEQVAQWNWDSTLVLTGGEPFLRTDIFQVIKSAVNKGLRIEAVSNGSLIDDKLAQKIVTSGLQNIAISLDGAEEATHDRIRQKGSFQKAKQAIANLVNAKKKYGTKLQISVWTTIMKENLKELFDIITVVRDLDVECLVYHPVIVSQDDMQNTHSVASFWISGDNIKLLKEQIDKIVDYQKKHGLIAFLHNPYLWIKYFEKCLTNNDWKCNPFVFINIGPDAQVRSCGSAFGNLNQMGLSDCLKTDQAGWARRSMQSCQKPCLQTCWAHPESDSLSELIEEFIFKISQSNLDSRNKKVVLTGALELLDGHEGLLRENHD